MLEGIQDFFSSPVGIMIITITVTILVTAIVSYILNKAAFVKCKQDKNIFVESCTEIGYRYQILIVRENKTKYTLLLHPGGISKIGENKIN